MLSWCFVELVRLDAEVSALDRLAFSAHELYKVFGCTWSEKSRWRDFLNVNGASASAK